MSNINHRKPLLEEVENQRNSRVILYVTGDRRGLETKIGQDVIDLFVDHLDVIGPVPKISLVLYTPGGDTAAAWNLVNLIRMFCEEFEVITPSKCRSSGTLICLGSDRIIMTKQATLGPIDPLVQHPLGPTIPGAISDARAEVSVEAVNGYLDAAKQYGGDAAATTKAFLYLSKKVHPLVLGQIFRSRQQIRDLAKRLLAMGESDQEKIEKIVDFLCSESGSHDYTINRREAKELGLSVGKCDDKLYRAIKEISSSYSEELEFRNTRRRNEALRQHVDSLPEELTNRQLSTEYTRAIIESVSHKAHHFVSRANIEINRDDDNETSIRELVNFEGWVVK